MPRRLTNDLLLALVLAQVLGGVLGWALPVAQAQPLYDAHRALGVAMVLLLGWKQAIALASLKRRLARRRKDASVVCGSLAALGLLTTLALGLAWTLNLISFDWLWGYSPLNVHVFIGIALVPFVAWHMLLRRRQNAVSAPVWSRRALLRVTGLSLATLVGWQAIERLAPHVRLPSGSKQIQTAAFPAEIWLFDAIPSIDANAWQLTVQGHAFSLADIAQRFPSAQVQAVLDCTSGWWTDQLWSGVRVVDVLRAADFPAHATRAAFTSRTGHRIVLPMEELQSALLATHVAGQELSPGHGYPVRLVAPNHRGYYWVKWLESIEAA
jgi:DMSO/TMAO reductase YedYZ molybdopterin-dependent catalytic subunit